MDPASIAALAAGLSSVLGAIFGFLYKSRCTEITCCCGLVECLRTPIRAGAVQKDEDGSL
eukprot:3136774-Pleurochrysis_carterae.AAC.2